MRTGICPGCQQRRVVVNRPRCDHQPPHLPATLHCPRPSRRLVVRQHKPCGVGRTPQQLHALPIPAQEETS